MQPLAVNLHMRQLCNVLLHFANKKLIQRPVLCLSGSAELYTFTESVLRCKSAGSQMHVYTCHTNRHAIIACTDMLLHFTHSCILKSVPDAS